MDLAIKDQYFIVGGATSGLGKAIAEQLLGEGAYVIAVARSKDTLETLASAYEGKCLAFPADLSDPRAIEELAEFVSGYPLAGCVFNAGGPPTGRIDEVKMSDWDRAYESTLRWKIQLSQLLVPGMQKRGYGRLLFVESVSIKQPIDNLVLSNAMRAAVAGFAKTLSREIGQEGITVNLLAPGYHATPRITTVLDKSAEIQGISLQEATVQFTAETATQSLGQPKDFATMAAYLLSPHAAYITGQTISVDGGLTRHITG
ncbi:SDR family oxidoreductase [Lewinella sp. W8]|uniref:SDR family oxidoreductase n=1 Tax=Lewinella sp. W8 TaxID=2528208 RepID=UPI001068ADB0|nr:SDR family oxidoreductase [Lewinella sp. W8]MTB53787.1 SDR family oxidoreductase [Lewinella sp. W8]